MLLISEYGTEAGGKLLRHTRSIGIYDLCLEQLQLEGIEYHTFGRLQQLEVNLYTAFEAKLATQLDIED